MSTHKATAACGRSTVGVFARQKLHHDVGVLRRLGVLAEAVVRVVALLALHIVMTWVEKGGDRPGVRVAHDRYGVDRWIQQRLVVGVVVSASDDPPLQLTVKQELGGTGA